MRIPRECSSARPREFRTSFLQLGNGVSKGTKPLGRGIARSVLGHWEPHHPSGLLKGGTNTPSPSQSRAAMLRGAQQQPASLPLRLRFEKQLNGMQKDGAGREPSSEWDQEPHTHPRHVPGGSGSHDPAATGAGGGSAQPRAPAQAPSAAGSQGTLPGTRVFGCKQSGSRSQALCLCLQLLRQLGASQESSPGASQATRQQQAGRRTDRWTDGLSPNTTRAEASVRRGLYCRAGSQRGAAAPLGSGFLKAVGAHMGENLGTWGPLVVAGEHGAGCGPGPLGQPHPRSSPAAPGHEHPCGGEGKRRLWCQRGGRQVPSRAAGLGTGCGPRWDWQGGCPGAGAEVGKVSVPAGHPEEQRSSRGRGVTAQGTDVALGQSPATSQSHPTSRQPGAGPSAASRAPRHAGTSRG